MFFPKICNRKSTTLSSYDKTRYFITLQNLTIATDCQNFAATHAHAIQPTYYQAINSQSLTFKMKQNYGLIGFPLRHSFSKKYFQEKFKRENINADYELFEMSEIEQFPDFLRKHPEIKGLNVTIPHKETIISYLNELSPEASEVGAVNCIKVIQKGGKTYTKGYNTDIYGFSKSLQNTGKNFSKALILGTGGAAKAVAFVLRNKGISYVFVSRKKAVSNDTINYSDLNAAVLSNYNLIINCTPLGTYPHTETYPDIAYKHLSGRHFMFDLTYNPSETLFLKKAAEFGASGKNGLEMLHMQAEKAWGIFSHK